ncbi:hypothetical protein HDV03_003289 [Kappamyces sp. JEL0829]|nr:hypothetical protein HDV03_003289 [Kappamyces sp. JEL0829]
MRKLKPRNKGRKHKPAIIETMASLSQPSSPVHQAKDVPSPTRSFDVSLESIDSTETLVDEKSLPDLCSSASEAATGSHCPEEDLFETISIHDPVECFEGNRTPYNSPAEEESDLDRGRSTAPSHGLEPSLDVQAQFISLALLYKDWVLSRPLVRVPLLAGAVCIFWFPALSAAFWLAVAYVLLPTARPRLSSTIYKVLAWLG